MYPGVYRIAGAPGSWRQALLAACLVGGEEAFASHLAAGGLWRLSNFGSGAIEIGVPRGRRVRRPGITVHQVRALLTADLTVVDAIPVTSPTRTLIDLSSVAPIEAVEEAMDDALRRGLTSIARLRWRLAGLQRSGRAGVGVVRELVDARGGGDAIPQSVIETKFLRTLVQAGLPLPARQYRVRQRGRVLAVVDFAYPRARLAIEVDGYRWHSGRARWEYDLARRNRLTAIGWRVIHLTSRGLDHRPHHVVHMVAEALSASAQKSGST